LASQEDWLALDVRVGTIVAAEPLRGARTPMLLVRVELGDGDIRSGVAPITDLYDPSELAGLQVAVVVNLPPERVSGSVSEVHILSVGDGRGENVLIMPERPVPDGGKVG
jgi:tRNA-binding protein